MASDYAQVQEQLDRYVYGRDNGHTDYSVKARMCEDFFEGKQWDEEAKAKLARVKRPALTFNKILPSCAAIFGEHLNNQADIGFKSTKGGTQETADVLGRLFVQINNANEMHWMESEVFADGVITSRGFYDARMNWDTNIFGEVDINLMNPRNVVIDPDAEEYDPDKWKDVITSRWLSENDIKLLYGKEVAQQLAGKQNSGQYLGYDFMDQRPDTFGGESRRFPEDNQKYNRRWRQLERQFKTVRRMEHFVDMVSGETRVIPEGMPPEKIQMIMQEFDVQVITRNTEVIDWRVTVDDELVHDEQSPYKHFTVVPFFPFFRRGRTIGLVENMIDPQELYNKVRSQELHIVNTTANSGWKVKANALQNMSIEDLEDRGAETGLIVELNDVNDLEKITPNTVPTGMDRISYNSANDLKEISMASDSMRGFDRADVAAKAIQAKQAQGSTNYTKVFDNLNYTRRLLAKRILDMVQTFYVEPRILNITGNNPGDEEEVITFNEVTPEGQVARDLTVGEYSVTVSSVPARETFEESQFEQAVQLRELGVDIKDEILIENSHLARKHEIAKEISGEPTEAEAELQAELAELEVEAKRLENMTAAATQKKTEAEAALTLVRAQQTALEDPNGSEGKAADDEIRLVEAEADREADVAKLSLEKYEIDEKLKIEREKLVLKREEIRIHELEVRNAAIAAERDSKQKAADSKLAAKSKDKAESPAASKEGAK
jgi:hypothetical protein